MGNPHVMVLDLASKSRDTSHNNNDADLIGKRQSPFQWWAHAARSVKIAPQSFEWRNTCMQHQHKQQSWFMLWQYKLCQTMHKCAVEALNHSVSKTYRAMCDAVSRWKLDTSGDSKRDSHRQINACSKVSPIWAIMEQLNFTTKCVCSCTTGNHEPLQANC